MKKFEYLTVNIPADGFWTKTVNVHSFNEILNTYGRDGWELVDKIAVDELGTIKSVVCVFKRELNNQF